VSDHVAAYDAQAERLVAEYEALDQTEYHANYSALLPSGPNRLALDVGTGSGRDAAWLSARGFDDLAAESSAGMRAAGRPSARRALAKGNVLCPNAKGQ
jgi:SAM-dependent methyltransferase